MSVEYILDRAGKKLGINPDDNHQRSIMLDYLNEGAQELYEESDMVGSLVEDSFYVQGDNESFRGRYAKQYQQYVLYDVYVH